MVVYQESYDLHNTFERRLFLNGKTYVQLSFYSEQEKQFIDRDEDDLIRQLCIDYRHYPEDIENGIWDCTGMGLQYGYVFDQAVFLYGGTSPDWVVKTLYDLSLDMAANGAVPATPIITIPPLADTVYQRSWHHDGTSDEILFFDDKKFSCKYARVTNCYESENCIGQPIFNQLTAQYDFFLTDVEPKCHNCWRWTAHKQPCYWLTRFLCKLREKGYITARRQS